MKRGKQVCAEVNFAPFTFLVGGLTLETRLPSFAIFMVIRAGYFGAILWLAGLALSLAQDGESPGGSPTGSPAGDFAEAFAYEQGGSSAQAIASYRRVIRNHPFAEEAARSQYRLAKVFEASGDYNRAFNEYTAYLTRFPDAPNFDEVIADQVRIANMYLDGKKVKILGLPIGSGFDRAQKMYASIVERAPFSRFAPMAQFNMGLAFEKQGRVQEAVDAYQKILDQYASSTVADDALYQIGYIYMRVGFAGGSQDLSSLVMAQNTFEDFLFQFPNSEKVPQAEENLRLINEREAGDILAIARFYDRYKNHRAAVIYYNDVIRRSPTGEDADFARTRIEELRSEFGEEALRAGPERTDTGERVAVRRRLQSQVETSALADFAGPPRSEIAREELPVVRPRLRTGMRDLPPMAPVEPDLPVE